MPSSGLSTELHVIRNGPVTSRASHGGSGGNGGNPKPHFKDDINPLDSQMDDIEAMLNENIIRDQIAALPKPWEEKPQREAEKKREREAYAPLTIND